MIISGGFFILYGMEYRHYTYCETLHDWMHLLTKINQINKDLVDDDAMEAIGLEKASRIWKENKYMGINTYYGELRLMGWTGEGHPNTNKIIVGKKEFIKIIHSTVYKMTPHKFIT